MNKHRAARGVTGILNREHPAVRGVNDPIHAKLHVSLAGRGSLAGSVRKRPGGAGTSRLNFL